VQSIAADKALADNIISAVHLLSVERAIDRNSLFPEYLPITDDDVWLCLEHMLNRRLQRNVIARARGLLERDGWFTRVADQPSPTTGRDVIAYVWSKP
jgi:hypothetical protein